ncbi:MAG: orotidine-5'-phosphate decarboxylase [Anaerolineae bacterium]|jgi:orotidine 5'-phosphate decarboxylase subfamily 2|nr:orotidine-5'-phosphate decarboxylase [Anaerolineae bacterium]MBT3712371.1 orotidine-5'-phosphate decarboxylase [Anaerolineae bacterium]MBT4310974.1 orotidine-5'-phosphate decarboxylase [Anaerolineae bacterium]MBT4459736.1 orotidine-5'-phosphate decarboxylase [Anaerolineae bacterium]MBT4841834.1 orotidine-5'-phosphate decarboxylase [Anaerolineae bacterium]
MNSFINTLERRAEDARSLLCIGLDPHLADLQHPTAESALDFCLRIVKETADYALAFKPNAAFFEIFGAEGWTALKKLIAHINALSIPIILDAKRGDIASTAEAYAKSAFDHLGADAITLNPYLGKDSVDPFIADAEKGAFLLCKTSNPGSDDLQNLTVDDGRSTVNRQRSMLLYEYVAKLAQSWNTNNNIGLVVGATQPEALAKVRAAAPDLWFLAPGVGAQGGDLATALRAGLRKDGLGMLISVSRSVARAENPRKAAAELRDEIINVKREIGF